VNVLELLQSHAEGDESSFRKAALQLAAAESTAGHVRVAEEIRAIIAKAKAIESLDLDETAALLHVKDPELWAEMRQAASEIKHKVYDNRIVTFAPLYLSNVCVNSCLYCGLRRENSAVARRTLSLDEIRSETEILAGKIGHKRLIVVYGEHPTSDLDYMLESIRTICVLLVSVLQSLIGITFE